MGLLGPPGKLAAQGELEKEKEVVAAGVKANKPYDFSIIVDSAYSIPLCLGWQGKSRSAWSFKINWWCVCIRVLFFILGSKGILVGAGSKAHSQSSKWGSKHSTLLAVFG